MNEVKTSFLSFPELEPPRQARLCFWIGALLLLGVVHSPPARMVATFHFGTQPGWALARSGICLAALLLLGLPLARDLWHYARGHGREVLVSLAIAAAIFPLLCILIHPAGFDAAGKLHIGRGLGPAYAAMSQDPLGNNDELYYRRLLQPLLAHWLRLDGSPNYGLFSLGCTFTLLVAQIHFLRVRSGSALMPSGRLWQGAIVVLALSTCAQIMIGIEWPGYPEQVAFLFLLIPAFVPMTSAARLAAATLALSGFDGVVFPLAAMILFCFPRRDRVPAFILIGSYLTMFAISYGFNVATAFELHYTIGPRSYRADLVRYPHIVLFGIFAAFKFYWFIVPVAILAALKEEKRRVACGMIAVTFSFIPLLLVAWDVTRLTAFSFVGLLFCVVAVYQFDTVHRAVRHYLMPAVAALSLAFPSYNLFLEEVRLFREPGLYRYIANKLPFTDGTGDRPRAEKARNNPSKGR
jgi:hypothetical protein